jgi:hypothetical protein
LAGRGVVWPVCGWLVAKGKEILRRVLTRIKVTLVFRLPRLGQFWPGRMQGASVNIVERNSTVISDGKRLLLFGK